MVEKAPEITILGGGPAGLAVGYYAKKADLLFTIYEASHQTGGHAVTFQHGEFRFDSGAHRFHGKDAEVTSDLKELLGQDLKKIYIPSHIYSGGKYIDFPLSPLNLMLKMGLLTFSKAGLELIYRRLSMPDGVDAHENSFEAFALRTYGDTVARLFLLNYSQKLWGKGAGELSPAIAGTRLRGLDFATFVRETFSGKRAKTEHFDGVFYYPTRGIGMIAEKIAEYCGTENIHSNARVTRVFHNYSSIQAVEINSEERIAVDDVVSTLPLPLLLRLMDPAPEPELLKIASELVFRNLILVTLFLDVDRVTKSGTIYFPGEEFPFTRVYEPKNRSAQMSPAGQTSLCVEIPSSENDELWAMTNEEWVEQVSSHLVELGWISREKIMDAKVIRLKNAYPVLDMNYEGKVGKLFDYMENFSNLEFVGRNARFLHASLHHMMRFGKEVAKKHAQRVNT